MAAPQELFDRPETLFAATFVGEPAMNTMPARLSEVGGRPYLSIGNGNVPLDRDWLASGTPLKAGADYTLGVRPQQITLCAPDDRCEGRVDGVIFALETLGSRVVFDIDVDDAVVRVMTSVDTARRFSSAIGAPIAFRVDPDFVYLFDPATGRALRQARFTHRRRV